MSIGKVEIFIDGENLSIRYKEMIKAGRKPKKDNVIFDDFFVWNQSILDSHLWNAIRINYYTSLVGDEDSIKAAVKKISSVRYKCITEEKWNPIKGGVFQTATGQIVPRVRKRESKSKKESVCDIAISVDVMRACYRNYIDKVWVFSGDSDFLELYKEAMHAGKQCIVSAFSSGLSPHVPHAIDEFIDLDKFFFEEE